MKKHSASTPRKMYWSSEVGGCSRCPECRATLHEERHPYLMVLRKGRHTDSLVVGSNGGHFCASCPVVVLDADTFDGYAAAAQDSGNGCDFVVLGLVDLSAVPKDKRHLPFDDSTNPVPVVMFTNLEEEPGSQPQ